MNAIQLHDQVLGFLDQARSGRIHPLMLDSTCNAVHEALMNQKIGTEGLVGPVFYYPEESTRIKDSLRFYYEEQLLSTSLTEFDLDALLLVSNLPYHLLLLSVDLNIGSIAVPQWVTPTPVNQKDGYEITQNKFLSPQKKEWITSYVTYSGGKLRIACASTMTHVQVRVGYIRRPMPVSHGLLKNFNDTIAGGTTLVVYSPRGTYNAVIYSRGEEITVTTPNLLTAGQYATNTADIDMDPSILGLMCREVASMISASKVGILNAGKDQ